MPPRRHQNLLPFKPPRSSQNWGARIFAAIFYVALAFLLTPVHSGSLTVLIAAALLYWFFLQRRFHRTGYLRQNALLLGIIALIVLVLFWSAVLPLLVLAGLFWLLVWRGHGDAPHFARYHLLSGLILNLGWVLGLLILQAAFGFIEALWRLVPVPLLPGGVASLFDLLGLVLIGGSALLLAIAALRGRTPFIPFVSAQVRSWT